MFTKLYLETTNPNLGFSQMFGPKILVPMIFSILVHTIVYTLFCNMISWIFFGSILSKVVNKRLLLSLLVIMTTGFFGRLLHVKEIYNAYGRDMKKTRKYIDKHYISWVFIS
jgi:membrane associated rhomboid family serine protease